MPRYEYNLSTLLTADRNYSNLICEGLGGGRREAIHHLLIGP